ncbi:MAG: GNAT family N-acetyltransferase [Elusimicrobia bacterium CG_4_10_14_0_2_um_filter_56_8]|nr:MAG: GNAT family N-acetyltransferase [Elusimicrobia bacterium CG1_02_56_21]PJA13009.1 MAG: GNAT family N-acetyltransferase [Elusimicrobia bacterium CG_4_10_14_0_2_um_filter_56_8]
MPDLLVKLYDLPSSAAAVEKLLGDGVQIRRAIGPEKHAIVEWAGKKFSRSWASECDVALSARPATCFVAVKDKQIAGFACYDATLKGFFGPIGVDETIQKKGLGKALLIRTLEAMKDAGYGYAAIGWAGPVEFFKKAVGATVIEGSEPGVYKNLIK